MCELDRRRRWPADAGGSYWSPEARNWTERGSFFFSDWSAMSPVSLGALQPESEKSEPVESAEAGETPRLRELSSAGSSDSAPSSWWAAGAEARGRRGMWTAREACGGGMVNGMRLKRSRAGR